MKKPIAIVAGVGNDSGTGAAAACVLRHFTTSVTAHINCHGHTNRRLFSQNDYLVALIARRADLLAKTANSVNELGGEEVQSASAIRIYLRVDSLSQRLALSQLLNT